ncbi:MAG TPA: hypothetical protein DCQ26_11680 [Marinilabiliales bacterium]|nr:MAG: hypothetical protein A2W95_07185 [Bacteroidetes bacterium GWA2_40_14]OFX71079.1 MAG: hypothetical protein A2W96_15155 [Bacteroidetes bacterium GWD2_40_43]OFX92438.1 MAG: hypothetical protein A2W97_10800 [Bacteroidetes bacterium GWE2_40_63]OFY23040.1 MAG: hypothetical protein A2W88_04785 [Bacteroidetes bacterium GWF2_40_13]OFZ29871.1 MAG: hypothetical protein A2437_00185 [Bacteroidetes bacterium RIFOXYC2_FULL_40_12]HAM99257.1 hypothetical protein [Marinilabiliales bacterium]
MIKRAEGLIVFFLFSCTFLLAQEYKTIDSLKLRLNLFATDTTQIRVNIQLSKQYEKFHTDSMLIYADQALKAAQKLGNEEWIARANNNLGFLFFQSGNFNRAFVYYHEVLKHYEAIQDEELLIPSYFNIALIFDKLNNNDKSQEYGFKAIKIAEKLIKENNAYASTLPIGRLYNNIGITFHNQKNYETALEYYNKAISVSEKTNNEVALPFVYNNIGNVYKEKQEYDIALSFYLKSLELRQKLDDWQGIALTYTYIADCYSLRNEYAKALSYYNQAYDISSENKFLELQRNTSEVLVELNAKSGDYKKAYEMHEVYKELTDSLNIMEGSRTALMLEMQYTFDKMQKEMEMLKQRRLFRNLTIMGVLVSLLIVITLLYLLANSKLRRTQLHRQTLSLEKEKLENELEFKNKELTTNVMYLLKKNELINSISQKLLTIKWKLKKDEDQRDVQEVINELLGSVDNDVWSEFELRFKDVHEDFYKKLQERYPELTPNERKLCAFMRLNMSTKEISNITFQSIHSITIARSRLRKKLNIVNTEVSLYDFLSTIE